MTNHQRKKKIKIAGTETHHFPANRRYKRKIMCAIRKPKPTVQYVSLPIDFAFSFSVPHFWLLSAEHTLVKGTSGDSLSEEHSSEM